MPAVYVKLLDEDVDVWRPVRAEQVEGDYYRLIDAPPEDEVWPFAKGDIVRCERRRFDGSPHEEALVAIERLP